MLNFIDIVKLSPDVQKWLGFAAPIVSFALNLLLVGIVLGVAFRIALISVSSITEFAKGKGEGNGSEIVLGAVRSIGATVAAGAVGFLLTMFGTPVLLDYAQQAVGSTLSDPAAQTGAVKAFFKNMPFLYVIFQAVQTFAQMGTILLGAILLAKTGYDTVGKISYASGSGSQFDPVKTGIQRAGFIALLAVLSYAAVTVGPDILFTYLSNASSQISVNGV